MEFDGCVALTFYDGASLITRYDGTARHVVLALQDAGAGAVLARGHWQSGAESYIPLNSDALDAPGPQGWMLIQYEAPARARWCPGCDARIVFHGGLCQPCALGEAAD